MPSEITSGLILLDKPKGPTSAKVALWVKDALGKKCGHCGTLDPNVSGVLPILFGKGIKLLEYLQKHRKEYVCVMETERAVPKKRLEAMFKEFTCRIFQNVPEDAAVARKIRRRKIYETELLELKDDLVLFRVSCQHGTYIRQLVEDFGRVLGMKMEMKELRRTKVAQFTEDECCSLTQLKDACELYREGKKEYLEKLVHPLEFAAMEMPKVYVKESAAEQIKKGADLYAAGLEKTGGMFEKDAAVAIMSGDKLVAVGRAKFDGKEIGTQKKGEIVDLEKVLA